MKSVLDVKVSCFKSYKGRVPKPVNLLTWLTSDKYANEVLKLRKVEDKSQRDKIKGSLPAITVSGLFDPVRKAEYLVKHSKLICIDIDPKDNEHISNFADLKEELYNIKNVAYAGLSVSGKGFFLIIPIAYPKHHKLHFNALKKDFISLGLTVDSAPQNVVSLRGYSYDSRSLFRHDAVTYRKRFDPNYKKKPTSKSIPFVFNSNIGTTKGRVEATIKQIIAKRIDITSSEPDWFRLACAFANEFGEFGRGYFHQVSQFYSGYDSTEANKKFTHALRGQFTSIRIGTFFKIVANSSVTKK
jgi:hypothetical protein